MMLHADVVSATPCPELAPRQAAATLHRPHELERRLRGEIARVSRHGGSLSLIALGLDTGEAVECAATDPVVTEAVAVIGTNSRASDVVGHWKACHLLIMAVATDLTEAVGFAVKLRRLMAEGGGLPRALPTASLGVAEYRPGEAMEQLVARADAAMRVASRRGGNRIATERDQ